MPIHDWTKVRAGIFHDFHHEWLSSIKHALNGGLLPDGYYAMVDQRLGEVIPDVLTLEGEPGPTASAGSRRANGSALLTKPQRKATAEIEIEFLRRRQKILTVCHVSDDEIVAMIEIMSPGKKSARRPLSAFVDKVPSTLERQIHVSVVDVFPPGRRDPNGIHGVIWEEIAGEKYRLPKRRPLTVVSYEAEAVVRAYVEHVAIGEELPDMPLFLEPGGCIEVPLERTYHEAFAEVPRKWQEVLSG